MLFATRKPLTGSLKSRLLPSGKVIVGIASRVIAVQAPALENYPARRSRIVR
jgi:hypothetical protein